MKKLSIITITVLLTLLVPFTSLAEDSNQLTVTDEENTANKDVVGNAIENEIIEELVNEWETNGYPDNVGYVYFDNSTGKYILGLVNIDEFDKSEIKSKLSTSENVEIEKATYAYNDLLSVQDTITKEIIAQSDNTKYIYGAEVGLTTIDGEVTGFGENGHEFRVVVTVDESMYDEYVEKYRSKYGDMVYVEAGDSGVEDTTTIAGQTENNIWLYMILFTMLCVAMLSVIINKRNRHVMLKQSANGELIGESRPLQRNEVILAIKESGIEPSDDVDKAILKEIKSKK